MRLWMLFGWLCVMGCETTGENDSDGSDDLPGFTDSTTDDSGVTDDGEEADADNDGVPESLDCNDNDADTYPGAPELCDGEDNDCNDAIDDGLPENTYYADADGDTYGDDTQALTTCESTPPQGYVATNGDCDDANSDISPGEPEVCDDIDNNCVDGIDDDDPNVVDGPCADVPV